MPLGTFGREFARFIRENEIKRLDTLLRPRQKHASILEYEVYRAYKVHDILHVVLGCDVSVMGEVQIVAFSFGQAFERGASMCRSSAIAPRVLSSSTGALQGADHARRSNQDGDAVVRARRFLFAARPLPIRGQVEPAGGGCAGGALRGPSGVKGNGAARSYMHLRRRGSGVQPTLTLGRVHGERERNGGPRGNARSLAHLRAW